MSTSRNEIRMLESRNSLRSMRLRHFAAVNRAATEMAYEPDSNHHRLRRSALLVRTTQNPRPHNDLWPRASWFELRPDLGTAPPVGFEPTTRRLTAGCSTAELQGNLASTPAMYSFLTRSNQSLQGMLSVVTFGSADPKTSCCHTLTLTLASLPCGSLFSKAVSGNAYRWLALRGAGSGRASKIFTSSESI